MTRGRALAWTLVVALVAVLLGAAFAPPAALVRGD